MNKLVRRVVIPFAFSWATLSPAQNPPPHFDHIVVIVQENRTPDNVFGSTVVTPCGGEEPFEPGVDIHGGGPNKVTGGTTCLTPQPLQTCIDPDHSHPGFLNMYDGGNMDGSCYGYQGCTPVQCPTYTYVDPDDVQPYFFIARNYGFANYFFQTNEGPSYPAHQFLFSGTSAPLGWSSNPVYCYNSANQPSVCWRWFDSENLAYPQHGAGCSAPSQNTSLDIDSNGNEWLGYQPPGFNFGYPCYDPPTLVDILPQGVSWEYYAPNEGSIWSAPTTVEHICGQIGKFPCPNFVKPNGKYAYNVSFESTNNLAPVFNDIQNCNLAAISWVIPDMRWSDHPGSNANVGLGPIYVAELADAIGLSSCTDPDNGKTYWHNTAILITWDDWGGWYDHVPPFKLGGQSNGWGQNYTYGFRVPLLVVSAYTQAGYVSGSCTSNCPQDVAPYVHDFGSILAFMEYNFLGWNAIGTIAPSEYPVADYWAPDWNNPTNNVPLQEFFQHSYQDFTLIPTPPGYNASYFANYQGDPEGPPGGPD